MVSFWHCINPTSFPSLPFKGRESYFTNVLCFLQQQVHFWKTLEGPWKTACFLMSCGHSLHWYAHHGHAHTNLFTAKVRIFGLSASKYYGKYIGIVFRVVTKFPLSFVSLIRSIAETDRSSFGFFVRENDCYSQVNIYLGCIRPKMIKLNWNSNHYWNRSYRYWLILCWARFTCSRLATWCLCNKSIFKILVSLRCNDWFECARGCKVFKFDRLIHCLLSDFWGNTVQTDLCFLCINGCRLSIDFSRKCLGERSKR